MCVYQPPNLRLLGWGIQCNIFSFTENKPDKYIHLPASNSQSFSFFKELEVRYMCLSFTWDMGANFCVTWYVCLLNKSSINIFFSWWLLEGNWCIQYFCFQVKSDIECCKMCSLDPRCKSVNVLPGNGTSPRKKFLCQLSTNVSPTNGRLMYQKTNNNN